MSETTKLNFQLSELIRAGWEISIAAADSHALTLAPTDCMIVFTAPRPRQEMLLEDDTVALQFQERPRVVYPCSVWRIGEALEGAIADVWRRVFEKAN